MTVQHKSQLIEKCVNVALNFRNMGGLDKDFLVDTYTQLINEYDWITPQALELIFTAQRDLQEIRTLLSSRSMTLTTRGNTRVNIAKRRTTK